MLPVRVAPVAGEAVDSWLEAVARSLDLSLCQLFRHLGISLRRQQALIRRLVPAEIALLVDATRVPAPDLLAMTLSRYDGTATELNENTGLVNQSFPFAARAGSRYCPECLAETVGRWQLQWRLGWSFVCVRHRCLLVDVCPDCARRPRRDPAQRFAVPSLCPCGADLASSSVVKFPEAHPVVAAQQIILDLIEHNHADFGVYAGSGHRQSARETLRDVMMLANRALSYASIYDFGAVKFADLSTVAGAADLAVTGPARQRRTKKAKPPLRAADTAVGVTAAVAILQAPNLNEAGDRARWLVEKQSVDRGPGELRSCFGEDSIAAAIVIKAHAPNMSAIDQLRWRTALLKPCAPDRRKEALKKRATSLPAMLWPAWQAQFPSITGVRSSKLSLVVTAATLMVGADASPSDVCESLGGFLSGVGLGRSLVVLGQSPQWPSIRAAICRLHEYLDKEASPIDYQRRRQLKYTALLTRSRWRALSRDLGMAATTDEEWAAARYYLIEKLSGSPTAREDLVGYRLSLSDMRYAVRDFPRLMTAPLARRLDGEARAFLNRNRIKEPLSWHPPLDLIADLGLVAQSPAAIDVNEVHCLAVDRKMTVRKLANQFDAAPAAIRYLFEQHPRASKTKSRPAKPILRRHRAVTEIDRLGRELDEATLRDLYSRQRLSVDSIADRYATTRSQIGRLRRRYAIPSRARPGWPTGSRSGRARMQHSGG
ncbi:transposase family protein [Mycobacterium rhizamassiliense]|uniref:Transposase family protein n=1 Tax=Mycobacterium rhizamassiliense TaxID=1841860 RepID=A0A2U3NQH5_9MYCO|nr:TniQ family protein [Mycobacterium rhizamassiliense]SPM33778.1 transposase family protein [Mycobacterium rhizamassiliense]